MAIVANASNVKEILPIKINEIVIDCEFTREINTVNSDIKNYAIDVLVDCGSEGDVVYAQAIEAGYNHRDARSIRRDFVRDCRGGTWAWIGICIGFIGHCD